MGAALVGTSLLALLAGPAVANAAKQPYPGAAPCNGTLQRCIDNSPERTKILIAKNVRENLEITNSVSLQPAQGSDPLIGSGSTLREIEVRAQGQRTLKVKLRGLEFRNVEVSFTLDRGSGHRILLAGSTFTNPFGDSNGISAVSAFSTRPSRIRIRNNDIATLGSPIELDADPAEDGVEMEIANNRLTSADAPAGVDPNDSSSGIEVDVNGTAKAEIDIFSNLIYGVAGCNCGGASGIEISGSAGDGTLNFMGNTVDDAQFSAPGLEVDDDDPGDFTVNLFDNIVSNASDDVVDFPGADPGLEINHDYNDFYDPGDPPDYGGYPPGPHTDQEDPLYVAAASADYRLQPVSPQKQQGIICPPGGQSRTDLAGNDRVERVAGSGAFVTPGAFGFAPGPPTGRFLLGTDQAETLTGGPEDDLICAYGEDDTATGGGGDDAIAGGDGADTITGGNGDDAIYGEAGQDDIDGNAGSDYLSGGDDFDEIESHDGTGGNDTLDGGGGVDACNPDPGDAFTNC
jgi:Ca2+-binding RTX toxin-like protein